MWEETENTHIPTSSTIYPDAKRAKEIIALAIPKNRNVIGNQDPYIQANVGGLAVETCTPGKQTPQNEIAGDVNPFDPENIVMGANDYRFFYATTRRYDGSGGVYTTHDGGKTWLIGLLPDLVIGNTDAPGIYDATGDPSISAGPENVFWYANITLDRVTGAGGVAVSRSSDSGDTWTTNYVVEAGSGGPNGFISHDKEWIGADPNNSNVAYVTWTRFQDGFPFASIVWSRTTDGGKHWSKGKRISTQDQNQGSVVVLDAEGTVHVVWLAFTVDSAQVEYSVRKGTHFSKPRVLSTVDEIRSPTTWGNIFTNSFPSLAVDGTTLHLVWPNWNGKDADIVYMRSVNSGVTWSSPVTIDSHASDQFLPRVAARNGIVAVAYLDHYKESKSFYHVTLVSSRDSGKTWSNPTKISSAHSDPEKGNRFGFPDCDSRFIGDYNTVAVDSIGRAHVFWTDIRKGNSPNDGGNAIDQDPYIATVRIQ
jgi:hypothetical protein